MLKSESNKAVALKYNVEKDMSPVVIASGYGKVAERIIDIAELKGIPVYRDDSASSLLCMLDVGNNIPPQLYEVIALIYSEIMKTSADIKNVENKTEKSDTLYERQSNFLKKRLSVTQQAAEKNEEE